jgi:hypothetical protein
MLTETIVERRETTALIPILTIPAPEPLGLQSWADCITRAAGQAVEAIIATGRLLAEAKEALPHGSFLKLFKGHYGAVAHPIPFSAAMARYLMTIAAHPVLSNRKYSYALPPSWRVLYELAASPLREWRRG